VVTLAKAGLPRQSSLAGSDTRASAGGMAEWSIAVVLKTVNSEGRQNATNAEAQAHKRNRRANTGLPKYAKPCTDSQPEAVR
jgi:hypothetical protein